MHHSLIPYRATEPGSPIDGAIDTSADLEVSKSAVAIGIYDSCPQIEIYWDLDWDEW